MVERDSVIDEHLLVSSTAHRIVGTFHDHVALAVREGQGRFSALYTVFQIPVDVLISDWLPSASNRGAKVATPFSEITEY